MYDQAGHAGQAGSDVQSDTLWITQQWHLLYLCNYCHFCVFLSNHRVQIKAVQLSIAHSKQLHILDTSGTISQSHQKPYRESDLEIGDWWRNRNFITVNATDW